MNKIYILLIILISLLILYNACIIKEGFSLSENEKQNFISLKKLNTPDTIYNISILEDNIDESDYNTYMLTEKWPWDNKTTKRYKTAILKNPIIRYSKKQAVYMAQRRYPQYAINYILNQQIESDRKRKQYEEFKKSYKKKLYPKGIGNFGFNSGLFS